MLRTLLAFVTGVFAAIMWLDRQTSPDRSRPAAPSTPSASPAPERVVEQVTVPDPEQAARIEELEAELAEQRAVRTSEPGDAHPGVDAIRAARMRALELERQLSQNNVDGGRRWFEIDPPALEDVSEAVAEHLPRVALWIHPNQVDPDTLWQTLGAMQEYAESSGGAWFEFEGDFAGWCRESGHAHALDPELPDTDEGRPTFKVEPKVNRSGQMVVPTIVKLGAQRLYYVDDVAGETGRMHVVGLG